MYISFQVIFFFFGKSLVDCEQGWGCFLLASSENNISVKEQSQKELQNNILTNKNSLSDKLVVCLQQLVWSTAVPLFLFKSPDICKYSLHLFAKKRG